MQEEIENRTVNLMITTTRLTARALISGYHKFEERRKQRAAAKSARKSQRPTGKQTVKQLIGQNQGVSSTGSSDDSGKGQSTPGSDGKGQSTQTTAPKTGDESNVTLWVILMLAAACAAGGLGIFAATKGRRRR